MGRHFCRFYPHFCQMKILIAEDDIACRRVVEETLERLGHSFLSTNNGDAAWDLFVQGEATVVLSGWMMPGIDGIELCRRIRVASEAPVGSPCTYFLLLTSPEDQGYFMSELRAGAEDYLIKPLNSVDLEAHLRAAERTTWRHPALARRDTLTDLYNRLQLGNDLEILRGRVENQGESWTVALCDVDHFKRYNDYYGHLAGDAVLRRVAGVLQNVSLQRGGSFRATAYRSGGEEFCLLMNLSSGAAQTALEEIRRRIAAMNIRHLGNKPSEIVSISVGMTSLLPGDLCSVDSVLRAADTALYAAKQKGRNRVISDAAPDLVGSL